MSGYAYTGGGHKIIRAEISLDSGSGTCHLAGWFACPQSEASPPGFCHPRNDCHAFVNEGQPKLLKSSEAGEAAA